MASSRTRAGQRQDQPLHKPESGRSNQLLENAKRSLQGLKPVRLQAGYVGAESPHFLKNRLFFKGWNRCYAEMMLCVVIVERGGEFDGGDGGGAEFGDDDAGGGVREMSGIAQRCARGNGERKNAENGISRASHIEDLTACSAMFDAGMADPRVDLRAECRNVQIVS